MSDQDKKLNDAAWAAWADSNVPDKLIDFDGFAEMQTVSLSGAALDYAVARATGVYVRVMPGMSHKSFHVWTAGTYTLYSPSTDWTVGGPLIDTHKVWLSAPYSARAEWTACVTWHANAIGGDTALIAACRAIVEFEIGDTVMIPKELAA